MTRPADLDFAYLTTVGRISGKPHRIEIWFAMRDEIVYMLAGDRERSDWVRNLIATPEVSLKIGARRRTTAARVVEPDTEEDAWARAALLDKYAARDDSDLTGWSRSALPIAVEWSSETTYTSLG